MGEQAAFPLSAEQSEGQAGILEMGWGLCPSCFRNCCPALSLTVRQVLPLPSTLGQAPVSLTFWGFSTSFLLSLCEEEQALPIFWKMKASQMKGCLVAAEPRESTGSQGTPSYRGLSRGPLCTELHQPGLQRPRLQLHSSVASIEMWYVIYSSALKRMFPLFCHD